MSVLTQKGFIALDYLHLARATDGSTSDGEISNDATFYDGEVNVAYVHWRTARHLYTCGFVNFRDIVVGTEIQLVPRPAPPEVSP